MHDKLLELVALRYGCFISTLRVQARDPRLKCVLIELFREGYDMKDWNYCLSYIYRKRIELSDKEALKRFLNDL